MDDTLETRRRVMDTDVRLLLGISGSGKTTQCLSEYRGALKRSLDHQRLGTTLWLTPTNRARRLLLDQLLDESLPICFSPNILTFDQFAEQVLQASDNGITKLTEVNRRLLLRRIIDELLQKQQLNYFAGIASTSGFLDLVVGFISELKRDEIWPDRFRDACHTRGITPKDRELCLIYERYQKWLLALKLYDAEGRFWSARILMEHGNRGPFEQLSLLVVDGFSDFTFTQYRILGHLAEIADRLLISLPLETELNRRDLFTKTDKVKSRLEGQFDASVKSTDCVDRIPNERPALRHLSECLFANPRTITKSSTAEGIEIWEAVGQLGEVRAIAQRCKQLLLKQIPPDEIVIACRGLDQYSTRFHEVFQASEIPYQCAESARLSHAPLLKALVAVLQVELDDWRFDRLMAVLDMNYFRPKWMQANCNDAVRAVASQLRHLKLDSQRQVILTAIARGAQANRDSDSSDSRSTVAAHNLLEGLDRSLSKLRKRHNFAGWIESILSVARDLGVAPQSSTNGMSADELKLHERDVSVWELFERILLDAVSFTKRLETVEPPIDLAEFVSELSDLLQSQTISNAAVQRGTVQILDATDVRNLDIPYLFLAGLTETSFPRIRTDDCLYNEAERKQLNELGLSMRDRSSQNQDEMLLFYGIVNRARSSLILSYPSISSSGQPLFSSPYLTAIRALFVEEAIGITSVGHLDPVPMSDCVLSPADLRVLALDQARHRRPGLFRSLFDLPTHAATARNLLANAEVSLNRFQTRGFTGYEGMLTQAEHKNSLQEQFNVEAEFSPTQLESYAACPFQFFVNNVLNVAPLETAEVRTDHRIRGLLVHEVLTLLHRRLLEEGIALHDLSAEAIADRFIELLEERSARHGQNSKLQKAMSRIEIKVLSKWAQAYGRQTQEYLAHFDGVWDDPPSPIQLEIPFGNVPDELDSSDDTHFTYLKLESASGQVRVRGRIDRVDIGRKSGQRVFNVIDYKTGRIKRFNWDHLRDGKSIQLALYLLAVRQLAIVGSEPVPFQMGFWELKADGFQTGLTKQKPETQLTSDDLQSINDVLSKLVPNLVSGIRSGHFPVASLDKDCTRFCPYNTVCRIQQIRALEETLDKRFHHSEHHD